MLLPLHLLHLLMMLMHLLIRLLLMLTGIVDPVAGTLLLLLNRR
jgi:hypothetical protein